MKKLWNKIKAFFVLIFGGAKKFEDFLREHADDAIAIVSKIKEAVENPIIISLISVLPDKYRNAVGQARAQVELILEKVLAQLVISETCLQKPTLSQRLQCFVDQIKQQPPAIQEALYQKFASLYAQYSSGTNEKRSRVDTAVQMRFLEQKENLS